jgi:hypothetical protein
MNIMANRVLRLKGRELIQNHSNGKNMHQIAMDGGVSYPTIHRYVTTPDKVQMFSVEALYGFLSGMGLTDAEIANLSFGEVFDLVDT